MFRKMTYAKVTKNSPKLNCAEFFLTYGSGINQQEALNICKHIELPEMINFENDVEKGINSIVDVCESFSNDF